MDAALGRRLRQVRETAGVSQEDACGAISVSQATYSRIETGQRIVDGAELVALADRFGVRTGVIVGDVLVRERAQMAARTDGTSSPMDVMREKLFAYLELDHYLADQGVL